jgi:diadenosine tetraphosphate (Ap4A) HIT family hydrolase
MCDQSNEYAFLKIKKYQYWEIALRNEQNYLGWCFVMLNRHLEDLTDISIEEQTELFEITKTLKMVIKNQFKADLFNYASLGNVTNHVHLQVIPRYKKSVNFENIKFMDHNWGRNYSPYDKNFDIPKEVKLKIIETIQKELE